MNYYEIPVLLFFCGLAMVEGSVRGQSHELDRIQNLDKEKTLHSEPGRGAEWLTGEALPESVIIWKRFIEVWIIADYDLLDQFNRDRESVKQRCINIVSNVNVIMKSLLIEVVLKGVDFSEYGSRDFSSTNHQDLLQNLPRKRNELLTQGKNHDLTVFLRGRRLRRRPSRCGNVAEMCGAKSVAAISQESKEIPESKVAELLAHDIGHLLGANHDDWRCQLKNSQKKGIMASGAIETAFWSNCSLVYIAKHIDRFSCLANIPSVVKEMSSCGNGKIDHGEQCDCGPAEVCNNPCCNAANCTLRYHAVCASGICCNIKTCNVQPTGKICRPSASECDLPEYCSGMSERCPSNVYKRDGTTCFGNKGTCFNGVCKSLDLLCQKLISPSATSPKQEHLDPQTTRRLNPCQKVVCLPHLRYEDDEFEVLTNRPRNDFSRVSPSSPLMIFSIEDSEGLTCDVNKTCIKGSCRYSRDVPAATACSSECSSNGICNSAGNCHCDQSFSPPDCFSPGFGGSINSGHSVNPQDAIDYVELSYMLLLFIVIPIIILILCIWGRLRTTYEARRKGCCDETCCAVCSQCLDHCCCPCMSFLSLWLCFLGMSTEPLKTTGTDQILNNGDNRKTICQVDMDVETPKAQVKTWGVASDSLTTDVITVTPKGSPQISKKVRLPSSSSPPLRSKSVENLDSDSGLRPGLYKSSSKDSGNEFLTGNLQEPTPPFKASMGSLISVFRRFGRQTSHQEKGTSISAAPSVQDMTKERDLRRIVVDPLSALKTPSRPDFKRSFSTDPRSNPAPQGSLHASEQNLHFLTYRRNGRPFPSRQRSNEESSLDKKIKKFEQVSSPESSPPAVRKPLLPQHPPTKPIVLKAHP